MNIIEFIDAQTAGPMLGWLELAGLFTAFVLLPELAVRLGLFALPLMFKSLRRRRIYGQGTQPGQVLGEIRDGLASNAADVLIYAAVVRYFWPYFEPGHTMSNIFAVNVFFEFGFYFSHRLFHTRMLWWLHRHHHEHKVVTPFTGSVFSVSERLWLWGINLAGFYLASFFIPISLSGLTIYLLLNFAYVTYVHVNVELLPPAISQHPLLFWWGQPYYHAIHHARSSGNYGGAWRIFDMMFKTEFKDHRDVQRQAWQGQSLMRPLERARSVVAAPLAPVAPVVRLRVQRREDRTPFQFALNLTADSHSILARTLDVAKSGAAIYLPAALPENAIFRAEFTSDAGERTYVAQVEVVNVQPFGDGFRCGLMFKEIEQRTSLKWESLIGVPKPAAA